MRCIKLTQGKYTSVDDEDYDYLMQWKWCFHKGYAVRNDNGVYTMMHRVINKTPIDLQTDHINMDKLDNRRCNLRSVTRAQNNMNRPSARNSTSKFKGVYWDTQRRKWVAQIKSIGLGKRYLGGFDNEEEAAIAYDRASIETSGGSIRTNIGGVLSAGKP